MRVGAPPCSEHGGAPRVRTLGAMSDALARMTEMQGLLEQVQADEAGLAGLAGRLEEHFGRVDRLRGYLDRWMEDREEVYADDPDADLPILGEDPLWESVEAASGLVRRLLTVCAAEVAAETVVDQPAD